MARAWLTRGPDQAVRVVSIEEIADLRYFERRLAGRIGSVPRRTSANDVSGMLVRAKVRHRPAPPVLERMARLIDQERLQQEIWKAHGAQIVKDWKRSRQGRLAVTGAAYRRQLKPEIEAAERRGNVELAREYSRVIETTRRFGPPRLSGTGWHSSALQLASATS